MKILEKYSYPLSLGGRVREGVQVVSIAKREEELFLP
jgi:hypothetical protein